MLTSTIVHGVSVMTVLFAVMKFVCVFLLIHFLFQIGHEDKEGLKLSNQKLFTMDEISGTRNMYLVGLNVCLTIIM